METIVAKIPEGSKYWSSVRDVERSNTSLEITSEIPDTTISIIKCKFENCEIKSLADIQIDYVTTLINCKLLLPNPLQFIRTKLKMYYQPVKNLDVRDLNGTYNYLYDVNVNLGQAIFRKIINIEAVSGIS